MTGTEQATQIYDSKRHTYAWYPTDHYELLEAEHMLPRLTIDQQKVLGAASEGPGVIERELGRFRDMTPRESKAAIVGLLEQELLMWGPIEEWHE